MLTIAALGLVAVISGCGGVNVTSGGNKVDRITGGGSSFVAPMMKKWAAEYNKAHGVEIDYTSSGSGNGVSQMIDQKNDFGCTDAPMNQEQLEKAARAGGEVVHIPLVMGGVVPVYHLPDVNKQLKFTGPVLADIFLGKIKRWNDPALVSINEAVALPDLPIAVAHRSDASGTSYAFTDYLSKVSTEWKDKVGKSTEPKWPVGDGAPKNPGVAQLVSGTVGSIGYVELIYAEENPALKLGAVQNMAGQFVTASLESVTAAAASLKDVPPDLRFSIADADGKDSYPISTAVWMVLYTKQPEKASALKDMIHWLTHEGQEYAKGLHYAQLPQSMVDQIDKKVELMKP
jgi:phosphate transport system substrate-binding protein